MIKLLPSYMSQNLVGPGTGSPWELWKEMHRVSRVPCSRSKPCPSETPAVFSLRMLFLRV